GKTAYSGKGVDYMFLIRSHTIMGGVMIPALTSSVCSIFRYGAASPMENLGFKIVKTNGSEELIARISTFEICKAAFEKALFVYPNDYLELRQGSRIILKSKDR